jgi:hypothetical protein
LNEEKNKKGSGELSIILNIDHNKLVTKASEQNWEHNKLEMLEKGIDRASYILGYQQGYESCYSMYDIDHLEDIIGFGRKWEQTH